ncbi:MULTISPECIES: O-phospho-L-seryl-tRNA:Cys-tRNA synthase [unclassified Archaeoglobus]|jgi:Sep-tRNA:Cys-tRNA synthetase|uniref:O-phospho-L-seryl-tRNA:Cys-tRNA synthase n=1 Tax=unclassified Archaeoglobus TaxID=2643606 RepID=UPI0025B980A8|nr:MULTISPECIES: O-phospho-L-seryl-tRNA:Cys-tRNA synthase [unclassified Archaeoglobus]
MERLERPSKGMINIHPIQRGGILTEEARKLLLEWGDGYSLCDLCFEGRVDLIDNPPVKKFKEEVAEFLGMDDVRFTAGARHAKFVAMSGFRGAVVLDSLAHYTSYIAAELNNLKVYEVPNTGYPEFRIEAERYAETFERVKEEIGEWPSLALLTHADYRYGNITEARKVAKICEEYGIPLILNAAYTSGLMEVKGDEIGCEFIVASGHKSWAATAPIGILATSFELAEEVFRTSEVRGTWSGRAFTKKEVTLFGCSPVYGLPLITLMASFPRVKERVKRWSKEVEKARWFVREMEKIEGVQLLGERPKNHTLMNFETASFNAIAKRHRRRGYFLYHELKERGIFGVHPGMTRNVKINIYGLSWNEVEVVANAFKDIAEKYGLEVED